MAPIIGIDGSSDDQKALEEHVLSHGATVGTFASQQPPRLVQLIASEIGVTDYSSIINWELELFDTQTAVAGGMNKEFIFAPRIDDKLCSWAAAEGLIEATSAVEKSSSIALVGLFDDEEIGSRLRQGAAGNFLPGTVERIVDAFATEGEGRSVSTLNPDPERRYNSLVPQSYSSANLSPVCTEPAVADICQQLPCICGRHACRQPQRTSSPPPVMRNLQSMT